MEHSGKSTARGYHSQPQAHYHHQPTPGQPQPPPPPRGTHPPPFHDQEEEKAESSVVVVTTQPTSAEPTAAPIEEKHNPVSIVALILSSVALFCCLWYYVSLFCLLPSFVLAVVSLGAQKKYQRHMAYVSIGCSIATFVIMGGLMFVIIISTVTPIEVARANALRRYYDGNNYYYYYG